MGFKLKKFVRKLADPLGLRKRISSVVGKALGPTAEAASRVALAVAIPGSATPREAITDLKQVAASRAGSLLSGRAILEGRVSAQDPSSLRTLDLFGSPATAGTVYQPLARAGALAFAAWTGLGALGASAASKLMASRAAFNLAMPRAQPELEPEYDDYEVEQEQAMFSDSFDWSGLLQTGANILQGQLERKAQQRYMDQVVPAPAYPAPQPMRAGWPMALGGAALGVLPFIGGAARAAAGLLRTAAGKVRGVMLGTGRFISSKKGAALAKRVGIDAAAVALGVSTVEMAEMVLAASEATRRGRGITGAQMKTTRRTIRAVQSLHREIVSACSSARVPSRGRGFARKAAACPPVRLIKVK